MSIRISAHVDSHGFIDVNVTDGAPGCVLSSRLWFTRRMGPIEGYPFPLESASRVHTVRSVTPQVNRLRAQSSPTLAMLSIGEMSAGYNVRIERTDGNGLSYSTVATLSTRSATITFPRGRSCGIAAEDAHCLNLVRSDLKDAILADAFVRAYLSTALWSSTMMPENDEASDRSYFSHGYDVDDCSLETIIGAKRDCDAFQLDNATDLELADENTDRDAHNFWLSRNGHGAGFFDRCDDVGTRLQDASRVFGEVNLYHVGDDASVVIYSDADVDTMGPFDLDAV